MIAMIYMSPAIAMSRREAIRRYIARVSRFDGMQVKAGSSEDCGHKPKGGLFTKGNRCAAGGGRDIAPGSKPIKVSDEDLPRQYRGLLSENELAVLRTGDRYNRFKSLADAAIKNEYGYIPPVNELMALAKLGISAKGQYEYAGKFMAEQIGEPAARLWAAINGVVSANTPWKAHTHASFKLIEEWFNADGPHGDDPESIEKIKDVIRKVQDQSVEGIGNLKVAINGSKIPKLIKLFSKYGQEITEDMISSPDRRKTIEFGNAFFDPKRSPIDKWMSELLVPDEIFPPEASDKLSELVRTDLQNNRGQYSKETKKAFKDLQKARKNIMEDPAKILAYKVAIAKAAKGLGWEPREVMESVWAATVAISMLKASGISDKNILSNMTHEAVSGSWDMESVFHDAGFKSAGSAGVSPSVVADIASLKGLPEEAPGKRTGKIRISPRDREAAQKAVGKIGLPGSETVKGRELHVPGKGGKGTRVRKRWPKRGKTREEMPHWWDQRKRKLRSRRPVSRFGADGMSGLVTASLGSNGDTTHQLSLNSADRQFLSSEQVGKAIANQYHNRRNSRYTPDEATKHWCASTLYKKMAVPAWLPSPYRPVAPDDPSHTKGPIIIDLKRNPLRKHLYGSFGQNTNIVVLDGKHRLAEFKQEHGDSDIEAFVGTECIPELERWVQEFGPKREAFIVSLAEFYDDQNPRSHWRPLIHAGREAGLSDDQLRLVWRNRQNGFRYCPIRGEFVPIHEEFMS